jgi:HAD superfamily hydrolase (TIGR01484 family)
MLPVTAISPETIASIRYILCDIDDTLTQNGYLLPEAFNALWSLHEAGYGIIPVTGRPAGWCDMIIRQWPVDAVIGENGALAMFRTSSGFDIRLHSSVASDEVRKKLKEVEELVCSSIPGMKLAKDQPFRWYDLAFDFAEDPPFFGMDTALKIQELCESRGAIAKISSIHVNAWFGSYSKLDMARELLADHFGIPDRELKEKVFFCGDSPNDEPMFSFFPLSCGVANIAPFLTLMSHPPAYITLAEGGRGFAEAAEIILESGKTAGKQLT